MSSVVDVMEKHAPSECRFKDAKCHACGKVGHISRACKSKQANRKQHTNPKNTTCRIATFHAYICLKINTASYKITVSVNDTTVEMEIDTGAAFSVISEDTYKHLCSQSKLPPPPLKDTRVVL